MTEYVKTAQRALGVVADGIWGPISQAAFLRALDAGRVTIQPLPAAPALRGLPVLPWVEDMRRMLGRHEVHDNDVLAAWLRDGGKYLGDPSAWPWCGDAVETAIVNALPNEPLPGPVGKNPFFARNWQSFGRRVDPATAYGAVGVFERGPRFGHVGFLMGRDDEAWHVLGGNQGDRVSVVRIARHRLLAARWPTTWPQDPVATPRLTVTGALSKNEA